MPMPQTTADRKNPRGGMWLRVASTVPALASAAAFAVAWLNWGGAFATTMAKTIQLEFLVIHAGLFLGVFIMVPVESALFRVLRWVVVALLAYMYLRAGYGLLGWHGVLTITGISLGTYGGFLLAPTALVDGESRRGRVATEIGVRWFISMLAYGLIGRVFELPQLVNTWTGLRASVAMGTLYFATLAMFEATPLYRLIRGTASASRKST